MSLSNLPQNSFALSADQQQILDGADIYAREQFAAYHQKMDDEEWWPPELFPALGKMGYVGVTVPEAFGGVGLDVFAQGLIAQAFGRYSPAIALSVGAHDNLCVNNIARNANEEQKRRYLPKLASGEWVGALGLTEPGAGSDALGSMRMTARREGDEYVLNGSKIYITNGPIADVLLVYAKTDVTRGKQGISAFIVEKDMPGFSVAQKLTKMGYRGSQTGELLFQDCRVPVANRVGPENAGVGIVMSGLDIERAALAPICLGMAERALEISIDYAKTRQQFGKPIAEFQMVQSKLADMYTWTEAMRSFCYAALTACNQIPEGEGGRGEIHKITAASILFCAEQCSRVIDAGVQIHGGTGYMWEAEINRLFRAAKLLEIGAGTSEVRRMIIAKELLLA